MEHSIMKYARRHLRLLICLICLSAALSFFVLSVQAQSTAILPPIGGGGGSQFVARCPQGQLLAGLELRTGDDVDAIRPLCITAYGPRATSAVPLTRGSGLVDTSYTLNGNRVYRAQLEAGWYGGTGGGLRNIICPSDQPIVQGMTVGAGGQATVIVNSIHLFCGVAATTQTTSEFPAAVFDGARPSQHYTPEHCSSGLVGVGINGRSGSWLDAVGLICGEPKVSSRPSICAAAREARGQNSPDAPYLEAQCRAAGAAGEVPPAILGRVTVEGASGPSGPPRPICELAREARARNSPAATGLEAQCRAAGAAGETPPAAVLGRVTVEEASGPFGPPRPICELAREARARNSPAASGLEAQCRAVGSAGEAPVDVNDLAARGEAVSNQDPLSAELRNRQPEGPVQRGFDIGMAAAEAQTSLGPGKQRIRDSLSREERGGFDTAVAFSLERNRNADLAAKGAAIAASDPVVAEARTVEADVFYWLGFDIATGLFGDPALGAKGNTATGPGSLQIRDSLSAAGQRGFNAAVKLHLGRNYRL